MICDPPILRSFRHRLAGISVRVRMLLLVVACVTVVASLIALAQAATILDAYRRLNGSALPMLTLAKSAKSELARMAPFFNTITTTKADLTKAVAETWIIEAFGPVKLDLIELRNFDIPQALVDQLSSHIQNSENSALSMLSNQIKYSETLAQLELVINALQRAERQTRQTLDELSFFVTERQKAILPQQFSNRTLDLGALEKKLNDHTNTLIQISNFKLLLDQIVTLASHTEKEFGIDLGQRDVLLISQKLRVMIGYLAKLPETESRKHLANQISQIRALLLQSDGIFDLQSRIAELRKQQSAQIENQFPVMAEISDIAAELVSLALAIVDESSNSLHSAIKTMIWQLVLSAFLVAVIVGIINFAIIERQFFRRINTLNTSVRAIANGDLSHPIPVSGSDELGDMARALRIFKDTSQDLRRSNSELQKFAYVAAHDLKTPLNAIRDLSSWTLADETNHLSEDSRTYLVLLIERTDRLSQLLADLLAYARIEQENPEPEMVDLERLVKEQHLQFDRERKFEVRIISPSSPVLCPRTPIAQILGNLIENAIQHHDQETGRIDVEVERHAQSLVITVSDDGPGIDGRYHQKVFEIFQTLRPRDVIEGNGMGLPILKKILDRHGGEIEIRSDPETRRGTVFCVNFPIETNSPDLRDTLSKHAAE